MNILYDVRPWQLRSRDRLDFVFFADGACFLPCFAQVLICFAGLRPPLSVGASPCNIPRHTKMTIRMLPLAAVTAPVT